MLSGILVACTGVATPIVGLIALTMTFVLAGTLTSPSSRYVGGMEGMVLYVTFLATPLFCLGHLASATGGLSLRMARWLWLFTLGQAVLAWLAFAIILSHGENNDSSVAGYAPVLVLLAVSTGAAVGGAVVTWLYRYD